MIRFISYAITMLVISILVDYLHERNTTVSEDGQTDHRYIVKVPSALKYVGYVLFGFGLFLFAFFLIFMLIGKGGVSIDHLNFSLIFAAIGMLYVLSVQSWRIVVDGEILEIHKFFHKNRRISFSDVEKAAYSKKKQIALFYKKKRIVTVDVVCDNYERLEKNLIQYGKLRETEDK